MRNNLKLLVCLIIFSQGISAQENIGLTNGQVYNGYGFENRNIYIVDGEFTFIKPNQLDTTIDVTGKFLIPPFAEAHTHRLADNYQLDIQISRFINSGVFYAQNLQYITSRAKSANSSLNIPTSVDVKHAYAALVAKGGHSYNLYKNLFSHGILREFASHDDLDGDVYFIIESEADLNEKWTQLLDIEPDIVKVYLEYSEEWAVRKDDDKYKGQKGINPKLLPKIVEKAHTNNLKVAAHVESAYDFEIAVKSGIDIIAHLPGFRWVDGKSEDDYLIKESTANLAKSKGIRIITTTAISPDFHKDNPSLLNRIRKTQKANLELLKNQGVTILIGSDLYSGTSVDELMNLSSLSVFSNQELINSICFETSKNLFPNRRIGEIREGFEGSLLVLEKNPLENLEAIRKIELAIKQGCILN